MEFETTKQVEAEDVALANAQRVTLTPMHDGVELATNTAAPADNLAVNRNFDFETESTASSTQPHTEPVQSHHLALTLALLTVAVFGTCLVFLFLSF